MQRLSLSRYPIDVVKIPVSKPLTEAFEEHAIKVREEDMSKEMQYALNNQLRLYFKGIMIKHTKIRQLVIEGLKTSLPKLSTYDGRPVNFDESELPVVAVYLTEPHPDPRYLDSNQWTATLHIELF